MEQEKENKNNIINACIDFLQNIDYNNKLVQLIVIIMSFFLLLKILGMFNFTINLNKCP